MKHQQLKTNSIQNINTQRSLEKQSNNKLFDEIPSNLHLYSAQQSIQQSFSPTKGDKFQDQLNSSEIHHNLRISFDELFQSEQQQQQQLQHKQLKQQQQQHLQSQVISNQDQDNNNTKNLNQQSMPTHYNSMKDSDRQKCLNNTSNNYQQNNAKDYNDNHEDDDGDQLKTLQNSSLLFKKQSHQKSKSIVSTEFQKLLQYNTKDNKSGGSNMVYIDGNLIDKQVLQETFQNLQFSYQSTTALNAKQRLNGSIQHFDMHRQQSINTTTKKSLTHQTSASFIDVTNTNSQSVKHSPTHKTIQRNPSKAETRYLNQASSPSFASVSSRNINQSFQQNDENYQPEISFRSTSRQMNHHEQSSQKKQNYNSISNQSSNSKSQQHQRHNSSRQSVISHSTNGTYYQNQLKNNSQMNQSRMVLTQNLFNGTQQTSSFGNCTSAGGQASIIIQKIESTTQKVTNEINDNQRLLKEQAIVKRDLQRHIELMKAEIAKLKKSQEMIQENIPQYADYTSQLTCKLSHKRSKSQDNLKDLLFLKSSIKQLEIDRESLAQRRLQIKQNLKFEGIRIANIQKSVQDMKIKIVQAQREKEKFINEISKQVKIIKNQQQRMNTISENSFKVYDNFEATTSKILKDKPQPKKHFKHK